MTRGRSPLIVAAGLIGALLPAAAAPPRRAEAYLKYFEAQQLIADGRAAEARQALESVLDLDPNASEVAATLGRLCFRDGDLICATERAERALALSPSNAAAHRVLAELDLQRFDRTHDRSALEEGLKHIADAVAASPTDAGTWAAWIRALANNGRPDEAEQVAARAAGTPGIDPSLPYLALARIYLGRGDSDRAVAVLDKVDVTGRGMVPILELLADLKGSRGDMAGQAAVLTRLRQLKPDDVELAHRLGVARLELGDYYGAEGPLREAFGSRPADPLVRRDLARSLVRLGRGREAMDLLRELPQAYRAQHTLLLWAQAAEQAEQYGEAADRLEDLTKSLGDDDRKSFGPALRLRTARDRLRAGQPERTLALTRGQDDDPAALRLTLQALDATHRSAEADALLHTRLDARPREGALIALLGERTLGQKNAQAAVDAMSAALRNAPDKARIAAESAEWLTAWDAPVIGASLLDTLGAPPAAGDLLRTRAATLFAAGRTSEAETAFRKLLGADPADHGAMNDLGFLLASEGRSLDEALQLLNRAVELKPDQPAYLDSLGWALYRAGRTGDALPVLQKAALKAREREEPAIREHLGDVYLALGDRDRALSEWSAALALGSDQRARLQQKVEELRGRSAR